MYYLKNFKNFTESLIINLTEFDINESLNVFIGNLLDSISAQKIDIYDVFNLKKNLNIDLETISNNKDFLSSLDKMGLKNSNVENTADYETFCNDIRFVFIYKKEQNELETPLYILLQEFQGEKWLTVDCYRINGDIKKFYDKLSSKIIEITDGDDKFIYSSSNKNEWILKSLKSTEIYKKYFRKEDLEKVIKERDAKIKII